MRNIAKAAFPCLRQWTLAASLALIGLGLIGCGTTPFAEVGPQEPLLPAIEGESKFSDRFELEEIPQFFHDLFGKELMEGHEVHHYGEAKKFDRAGNLFAGFSAQWDTMRFAIELDHEVLTHDTFRGRHAEAAIGDHLRILPETLFPAGYIIRKTEFDGQRFDISFSHERHLFTLLNTRMSNSIFIPATGNLQTLGGGAGRRTSTQSADFLANSRIIGFRAQGMIGDIFRVGATYMNVRQEFHQRTHNPFFGSVPNTPPQILVLTFRDDSPEDGRVGAAFQSMDVVIRYREELYDVEVITDDPNTGEPLEEPIVIRTPHETEEQTLTWQVAYDEMQDGNLTGNVLSGGSPDPTVTTQLPSSDPRIVRNVGADNADYPFLGDWRVANGFDAFHYALDLTNLPEAAANELGSRVLNPAVVISIEFKNVKVAGDYNIVMNGYSPFNVGDEDGQLLNMDETGLIKMPYRDVVQAPGNIGQEQGQDIDVSDPNGWNPKTISSLQYGAPRSAVLAGVDLEGTIGNVLIRAQYSVNNKYKAYPTVAEERIDIYLLEQDSGIANATVGDAADFKYDEESEGRTFSANNGAEFKFTPGGDNHDSAEVAWFVSLEHRLGRILFKEAFYHIDPGYTTNYNGWGNNNARDDVYGANPGAWPETRDDLGDGAEVIPNTNGFNEDIYRFVEDDDDRDSFPDSIDFDGVLPQADDRDQNGILDYQEDFLIFDADPPIFDDLIDHDNNGIIDSLEDDYEPDYEYGIDRRGYHIEVAWDIFDNMTTTFGWLNESEVSSARRNNSRYLHFDFQRDIAELGTFRLQDRLRIVDDDIPDYSIALVPGALGEDQVDDQLDFYNATENTTTLQFLYNAINNLTLETKYLFTIGRQSPPSDERLIFPDDPDTPDIDERIDLMVPQVQVNISGGQREYPFYPDPELIFDIDNWQGRRYGIQSYWDEDGNVITEEGKTLNQQLLVFRARYDIPLKEIGGLQSIVESISEDIVISPVYKYILERSSDRSRDSLYISRFNLGDFEKGTRFALDPINVLPGDAESREYLRFNKNSREIVEGIRFDYQFTQKTKIVAGFQYRKFINKDKDYQRYLGVIPDGLDSAPVEYRPDSRTRIFELQLIQEGSWQGFTVAILSGFRIYRDVLNNVESNSTYIRAITGF